MRVRHHGPPNIQGIEIPTAIINPQLSRLDRSRMRPGDKEKLERGIELEGGKTYPAVIEAVKTEPFSYRVTIHEGRKRQLRLMFQSLGPRVLALKRVRMGGLILGSLGEGEIRELTGKEVKDLLGNIPGEKQRQ